MAAGTSTRSSGPRSRSRSRSALARLAEAGRVERTWRGVDKAQHEVRGEPRAGRPGGDAPRSVAGGDEQPVGPRHAPDERAPVAAEGPGADANRLNAGTPYLRHELRATPDDPRHECGRVGLVLEKRRAQRGSAARSDEAEADARLLVEDAARRAVRFGRASIRRLDRRVDLGLLEHVVWRSLEGELRDDAP